MNESEISKKVNVVSHETVLCTNIHGAKEQGMRIEGKE